MTQPVEIEARQIAAERLSWGPDDFEVVQAESDSNSRMRGTAAVLELLNRAEDPG